MPTTEVLLEQHKELSSIAQSRSLPAGYVFHARLILMLAEGATFSMIQKQLRTTAPTIIRWKVRFLQLGMNGLDTHHPGPPGQHRIIGLKDGFEALAVEPLHLQRSEQYLDHALSQQLPLRFIEARMPCLLITTRKSSLAYLLPRSE